jgi:hypothetical protein
LRYLGIVICNAGKAPHFPLFFSQFRLLTTLDCKIAKKRWMRVCLLLLAALGAPAFATNINTTFAELQASFSKEVSAVVGDVLWSLSFDSVKLTFSTGGLDGHGVCESPSDDITSFLSDMTT